MNLLTLLLAAFVFASVFERLTMINWLTARFRSMAAYVAIDALAFWAGYSAAFEIAAWWQVLGLAVIALWLVVSRENWRHGVPAKVSTIRDELGPPEIERFR